MANNQETTGPKTETDGASDDEQGRYVVPGNRRDFLRTVGVAGAASIGTLGTAGVASADDSTNYDSSYVDPVMAKSARKRADYSACSNYGGRRVSNSTSLIYWGSEYLPSSGHWYHMFSASTHGRCEDRQCTEDNWHPANTLERIKYTWETAHTSGSKVTEPLLNNVGADPAPSTGNDPDYDDPVFTVLEEVVSEADEVFGYVIAATNIVTSLVNDRPDDSGPVVIYDWDYGGSTDKANVSYDFEVQSNHEWIDFDFEALVREDHYNPHATTSWSIERSADEIN